MTQRALSVNVLSYNAVDLLYETHEYSRALKYMYWK